jgi:hypothetical protein
VEDLPVSEGVGEPAPGERLFYTLGQLYRRWRSGTGRASPQDVDVEALARTLGVWRDVEFSETDATGKLTCLHFPSEVLVIDRACEFPWRLLGVWDWALERERQDNYRLFEEYDR